MDTLEWLERWFLLNSNGDGEHEQVILIQNFDNPGWNVEILMPQPIDYKNILTSFDYDASDEDWWGYKIKSGKFMGYGSPNNLSNILKSFRKLVDGEL